MVSGPTHIWEAETEVHDAQWIPTVALGRQYSKCGVLALVLVDINRIYIYCKSLVVPNV